MLPFLKYSFSEDFPYSNGPDDGEYKKLRQKFIFTTSAINGTEKWIEDKELQYMLHVELRTYYQMKIIFLRFSFREFGQTGQEGIYFPR
jgi:hypothetical protein